MAKICQKIKDSTQCKTDRVEIDLCEFKERTEQSIANVPNHFLFLSHVVCVNSLNQVFGISTILSGLFTKVKPGLQKTTWSKPGSPFPN